MMDHRFQILLDETRYQKLTREAERRGTSVAAVIRDAIDRLPEDQEVKRRALQAILSAAPMPLPHDPGELRREIDAARGADPR